MCVFATFIKRIMKIKIKILCEVVLCKVLLMLLLVVFSSNAYGNAIVFGVVKYQDGTPASDVILNVNNTSIFGVSDENGKYQLENVPLGQHAIIVKPFGENLKIVHVRVASDRTHFPIELNGTTNTQKLNEVVVRGQSQARQLKDRGFAVGIVETQNLALQNIQTSELLDRTAGIRIRQSGGMGSSHDFNINGLSGNSVRIFIDGMPIRNYGASFSISSIPPAQIERIEVYKGVIPPHLSEDALGGAVNVVLKKDVRARKSLLASYSFGSFNTHQGNVNGNYRDAKTGFTVMASAFYNYSDNDYQVWGDQVFVSEAPTWALQYVKARRFHDAYQSFGLNADIGFTNVKWADKFLIGTLISEMDKDVQHGGTMQVVYGNRRTGQQTKMLNMRYEKRRILKKIDLNGFMSYTQGERWVTDTIPHIYNWLGNRLWNENKNDYFSWNVGGGEAGKATLANNFETTLAARANASVEIVKHHRLNTNYLLNSFARDIIDPLLPIAEQELTDTRFMNKQILGFSYDAQMFDKKLKSSIFWKYYKQTVSLKDPVRVNNVLTHTKIDKTVDNNGYGAAFSYIINKKLMILSSFEKAIRLPENSELLGNTSDNVTASYELLPESSYNFNIGINIGPFEKENHIFRTDVNLFYRNIRDMIMRGAENSATGNYGFENIGQILSRGFDLELVYEYNRKLMASFNLSLFNARYNLQYDSHGVEYSYYGDRLRNAPYFTSNTNVEYDFGSVLQKKSKLKLNYNFAYVHEFFRNWESIGGAGKATIPTQMIHDMGLTYSFPAEKITLSVNAKNMFNAQAFDNWALQKPGRAFYAKLSYRIL